MLQSELFPQTLKNPPRDEVSRNAQLLVQAGFIQKLMAGVYTILPLGFKVLKKIEQIIRKEMNAIGGQELFMPALHPLDYYLQTKRDKIDILFHLDSSLGKKIVLGQSHEEVIVPLVKKYINSYKDLPLYLYQFQVKFRNELRAKSGILRGREFIMKDLYSFHRDETDFQKCYELVKKAYYEIFSRCGIGPTTYLTFASGGTFSQYSHEFQTITPAGEDTIHICSKCQIAVNDDIFAEQKNCCPVCGNKNLFSQKSIEVGNIFPLKTRFSESFDLNYQDEKGEKKLVVMGSYGIGLGRLMGTIAETNNDQNGIIWPKTVTPFEVHLICLENEQEIKSRANKIYHSLQKQGIEVLFDDRVDSAGPKLKDADLIGIPIRLVISPKTGDKIEIKFRKQEEIRLVTLKEVLKIIGEYY